MSTHNDGLQHSGKPSFFSAEQTDTTAAQENNRVLAHLEGQPHSRLKSKTIVKALAAALLIGGVAVFAWKPSSKYERSDLAKNSTIAVPAQSEQQPAQTPASAPVIEPARILQDSSIEASISDTDAMNEEGHSISNPASHITSAALASAAPVAIGSSAAKAKKSAASPKVHAKAERAASTQRASASKRRVPNPKATSNSDAEVLATLLERRDPQDIAAVPKE